MDKKNIFMVDLETTGFNNFGRDVILQISICQISDDKMVKEVYSSLVRYLKFENDNFTKYVNNCWWMSEKGLRYERDFRYAPDIREVWNEIRSILEGEFVISWNMKFDFGDFLDRIDKGIFMDYNLQKINYKKLKCPMVIATKHVGVLNYKGGLKWPKLIEAANFYKVNQDFGDNMYHDASIDTQVASIVFLKMIELEHYDLSGYPELIGFVKNVI